MRLEVVLGGETARRIQEAIDLDRHIDPTGDVAGLLDRALSQYVKSRRKAKFAETSRPRAARDMTPGLGTKSSKSERVSAAVRREVAVRDGHQCAWIGPDGHRCNETSFLEFDHVHAKALGGTGQKSTDVRLLCRAHPTGTSFGRNRRAAEKSFGQSYIARARGDVESALVNSGFARKEAREGARVALEQAAPDTPVIELIRDAFRHLGSVMELSRAKSP